MTLEDPLFARVVHALLSGYPGRDYLDAQRERYLAAMQEITTTRRLASLQDSLLADYQLFHIEADLRWMEHAIGRLDALAAEIGL